MRYDEETLGTLLRFVTYAYEWWVREWVVLPSGRESMVDLVVVYK
jgi:hypothetical protein